MSSTLVIADLHLCESRPDITRCFLSFLDDNQNKHDALYILGDLFEAWIGDDDINDFTSEVASAIKRFSLSTPVFFCHGNRDFLVGYRYCQRAGMTLLPELHQIRLYDRDVVLMHGDQLCIDDIDYQKFRKRSRSWWWQKLMLLFPLSKRRQIASDIRTKSKQSQAGKSLDIMDVASREVTRVVNNTQCEWLVHGHTHRPCLHDLNDDTLSSADSITPNVTSPHTYRMVVGDWYEQGSVLILTPQGARLTSLPFNKPEQH